MKRDIIIPLCGLGSRFKDFTEIKPLIKVFEKEIFAYTLDIIKDNNVYVIYNNRLLDNFLSKYENIILIYLDINTRGSLETLKLGLEKIEKKLINFMVMDCDTYYTENIIDLYKGGNSVFYMQNKETDPKFSYITIENNKITDIIEKVKISDNANTGIYCFSDSDEVIRYSNYVIDNLLMFKSEFYISCLIKHMIDNDNVFYSIKLNHVYSLGTPEQVKIYKNNCIFYLFDLDGTLVLTDEIYKKVWNEILNPYGIIIDEELFDKYIRGNTDINVVDFFLGIEIENISSIKDNLFIENIDKIEIISSSIDYLNKIKLNGNKVAIVTNCNKKACYEILKYCKFNHLIDIIITSEDCLNGKPYPDPYIKAIKKFNTTNDKCIIFEDSKTGIVSGLSTTPKCIFGITTNHNKKYLLSLGVDITIDNYDLLETIDINYQNINTIKKDIKYSLGLKINEILIDDIKLKGGFISDVVKIKIKTEVKEIDCVLKIENNNETSLSKMATFLDLYNREYYFYEILSKYVPLNIPEFYGVIKKTSTGEKFGILIEDLSNTHILNLNLNLESIEITLKIVDNLSKLHSKFWNKKLDFSFNNDNWIDFIKEKYPLFRRKWIKLIPDIEKIDYIYDNFEFISNSLNNGNNLTLCHGDVKSPNIFYRKTDKEPFFIDWQYISKGKGVKDLVFFMIESFDLSTVKKYKSLIKEYYYIKLLESGIIYKREDFEKDFELASYYFPFFVSVWFGTVPDDELIDKNFPLIFIKKFLNFI